MKRRVFIVGVGMTKFEKPGRRTVTAEDGTERAWDYPDMALESGTKALEDAGIPYETVEQACVGYVYGDSTAGQRAVYGLGLTGIPVYNVNNNCSTGSTALMMARQFVEGGLNECVLALGFEKMKPGSLRRHGLRRPRHAARQALHEDGRAARLRAVAARPADLRQRGARAHGALRHLRRVVRPHRREEPPPLGEQPVRAVPGRLHARAGARGHDDPRPADQAAVLADLRRLRGGDRVLRGRSSASTASPTRRSRSSPRRWSPTPRRPSAAR